MPKNNCCVPECRNENASRHRFPKDVDLCKLWVELIKNCKLNNMDPSEIRKRDFRVCGIHFEDKYKNASGGLLKNDTTPTLFLPGSGNCMESARVTFDPFEKISDLFKDDIEETNIPIEATDSLPQTSTAILDESQNASPEYGNQIESRRHLISVTPTSSLKQTRGKRNLFLKSVNASRQHQLTPKCKKLYKQVTEWSRKMSQSQRKVMNMETRLKMAKKALNSSIFPELLSNVNRPTYIFILQQLRTQKQKPKARRYTLEEKILCLSLLKSSGRGFNLLSKIFSLPSKRTLCNMLNNLLFKPGLNKHILETLKSSAAKMGSLEKCCVLMFDEIHLTHSLSYNTREDKIVGLHDNGLIANRKFADHANVFMLKGVYKSWKQPISFTFSAGPTTSLQLKIQIKEVITAIQDIGFDIVAVVCDQGASNISAVNALLRESRGQGFNTYKCNGDDIVFLFDVPHLFKCIRNNLLTKDLNSTMNGTENTAKWNDVVQLYNLDSEEEVRLCPKLNDTHVIKNKINKMKVASCTQVFSYQVGSLMKRIAGWDIQSEHKLEKRAVQTAETILFLDKLFDSLNCSSKTSPQSKPLKGGVTRDSPHLEFWLQSIDILRTMSFKYPQNYRGSKTPTIKNLILTIKGFITLRDNLLQKGFNYILTRSFNQDPLENFFGLIRSHNITNHKPGVQNFTNSFKSLIISNFLSHHSPGSNCEVDFSEGALDNLAKYVTTSSASVLCEEEQAVDIPKNVPDPMKVEAYKLHLKRLKGKGPKK